MALNAGRGGQVSDEDLIKALGCWHIAGATLDVFHTAPLASDHPFWAHSKVTVTPHASSLSTAHSGAPQTEEHIPSALSGQSLLNVIDCDARY